MSTSSSYMLCSYCFMLLYIKKNDLNLCQSVGFRNFKLIPLLKNKGPCLWPKPSVQVLELVL